MCSEPVHIMCSGMQPAPQSTVLCCQSTLCKKNVLPEHSTVLEHIIPSYHSAVLCCDQAQNADINWSIMCSMIPVMCSHTMYYVLKPTCYVLKYHTLCALRYMLCAQSQHILCCVCTCSVLPKRLLCAVYAPVMCCVCACPVLQDHKRLF